MIATKLNRTVDMLIQQMLAQVLYDRKLVV